MSFCNVTKGITSKICRLCVCVIINKRFLGCFFFFFFFWGGGGLTLYVFGSYFGTLAVIFALDVYAQNNQNKYANKTVCKYSTFSGQLGSPDLFPSKTFQRGPILIPDKFETMISTKQLLCKMVCTQCKKKVCHTQS